jgi:phosphate transport system substrate-binding protein
MHEVATPSRGITSIAFAVVSTVFMLLTFALAIGDQWLYPAQGTHAAELKDPHNAILRLADSNTIQDSLGPALAEAFLKAQGATNVKIYPGENPQEKIVQGVLPGDAFASSITIASHGSETAFTALAEDTCDIGMTARRIKPDEAAKLAPQGGAASEHILGLDGIAVIVNASNPLNELRKEQIKQIFTGYITDWSKLEPSSHGTIQIYAKEDQSGITDTFKSLVLTGKPIAVSAHSFQDSNAISEAVAGDPNGIGFISLPFVHSAKSIAVSDNGAGALKPNKLTVATEDYPLTRRLYLYTHATPHNAFTQKFVEFALSRQGQEVVAANGFVAQNVAQASQSVSYAAPVEYRQLTKNAERLSLDFRFDAADLSHDSKAQADLDRVVSQIADEGETKNRVMLFGFTDNAGTPEESRSLSLNRARMVESQLVQRGIKPTIVRGFGSELPIAANDTAEGREKNQRVEIWIQK